jgi:hypothetical protein
LRNDACKGYGEKQSEGNQSASGDSDAHSSLLPSSSGDGAVST